MTGAVAGAGDVTGAPARGGAGPRDDGEAGAGVAERKHGISDFGGRGSPAMTAKAIWRSHSASCYTNPRDGRWADQSSNTYRGLMAMLRRLMAKYGSATIST